MSGEQRELRRHMVLLCHKIGMCVNVIDTGISLAQLILPATHILLVSPDPTAISDITKPGPHPGQPFSLSFRQKADILLSLYRNLKIQIVWAPQDRALHGFVHTKHLTDTIAPRPLLSNHREPHSVSYQRREAKASAIDTWADRCLSNYHRSQTYIALPTPPNGQILPVIQGSKGHDSFLHPCQAHHGPHLHQVVHGQISP
jgi:hypothetical protein